MRLLWLKLMLSVSDEGGIVIKTFGMRATYINLLQVRVSDLGRAALSCINNITDPADYSFGYPLCCRWSFGQPAWLP